MQNAHLRLWLLEYHRITEKTSARIRVRVAYAPTGYYPAESPPVLPSRESLRADLRVPGLRRLAKTRLRKPGRAKCRAVLPPLNW